MTLFQRNAREHDDRVRLLRSMHSDHRALFFSVFTDISEMLLSSHRNKLLALEQRNQATTTTTTK